MVFVGWFGEHSRPRVFCRGGGGMRGTPAGKSKELESWVLARRRGFRKKEGRVLRTCGGEVMAENLQGWNHLVQSYVPRARTARLVRRGEVTQHNGTGARRRPHGASEITKGSKTKSSG